MTLTAAVPPRLAMKALRSTSMCAPPRLCSRTSRTMACRAIAAFAAKADFSRLLYSRGGQLAQPFLCERPGRVGGGLSGPKTHFPLLRPALQGGVGKHGFTVFLDQLRVVSDVLGDVEEVPEPAGDQRPMIGGPGGFELLHRQLPLTLLCDALLAQRFFELGAAGA